jgi:hypothetical protein
MLCYVMLCYEHETAVKWKIEPYNRKIVTINDSSLIEMKWQQNIKMNSSCILSRQASILNITQQSAIVAYTLYVGLR